MTKKQLAEYKRQLKDAYQKNPEGYDRWKESLYQEPDGFFAMCEKNYGELLEAIPDEALAYFEKDKNNLWLAKNHLDTPEAMQQYVNRTTADMMKYAPTVLDNLMRLLSSDQASLHFMHYWLLCDKGTIALKRFYCQHFIPDNSGFLSRKFMSFIVGSILKVSIRRMIATKSEWKAELLEEEDPAVKAEIKEGLYFEPGVSHGRNEEYFPLEALLTTEDKPLIISRIGKMVAERKSDMELACLLYALLTNGLILKCSYTIFHRALQKQYPTTNIGGVDYPQKIYGKICAHDPDGKNTKGNLDARDLEAFKERQRKSIAETYNRFYYSFLGIKELTNS